MAPVGRKKLGVLLGSMAIAALPTPDAEAVPETEPNSTFPGQSASVDVLITGTLGQLSCPGCPPAGDFIDFFHYTGLPVGGAYDLTLTTGFTLAGHSLQAGLYTDQTNFTSPVSASSGLPGHLTGIVPPGGALTFGVTEGFSPTNVESYSVILNVTTPTAVPEPATIALVAAGVSALGVTAARRRKRD